MFLTLLYYVTKGEHSFVPIKFSHVPLSKLVSGDEEVDDEKIPVFKSDDGQFLSIVHVTLKLHGDILSQPQFKGVDVNEQEEIDCVPSSL